MRSINRASQFKKDFKSALKQGKDIDALKQVIEWLLTDTPLPPRYRDHNLTGNWKGFRECHLAPNWLLIYRVDSEELLLARLGSHSELFR